MYITVISAPHGSSVDPGFFLLASDWASAFMKPYLTKMAKSFIKPCVNVYLLTELGVIRIIFLRLIFNIYMEVNL